MHLRALPFVAIVPCVLAAPVAAQSPVVTTLDSAGVVGASSDLARRADRRGFVAYSDTTNARLKAASCVDVACTSAALGVIDADGPFDSVSVAIEPSGRPVVVYRHQPSGAFRFARCADADCTSAETVSLDGSGSAVSGTEVVIGADGLPLILHGDDASSLTVAHCEDAGCAARTVTEYPGGSSGPTAALGLDGRVVFANASTPNLRVGHCSNVACTSATFTGLTGIFTPSFVRSYSSPSIALGGDGRMALVVSRTEQGFPFPPPAVLLELRRCVDVACTSLGPNTLPVTFAGSSTTIAVAPGDRPVVAQYGGDGAGGLRLAVLRCATPACPSGSPVTVIDAEFVGSDNSMALSPVGDALLSYHHPASGDLKVAWLGTSGEIAIGDVQVQEGASGQTLASFAVTLGGGSPATVDFATADGTATAGGDYVAASGSLTLTPDAPIQTVTVAVLGDTLPEPDETFRVLLSNPQGAPIVDDEGVATIVDDEPHLSVSDLTIVEGNAGATDALFLVSIDPPAGAVQVDFASGGLTATSGVDFLAAAGTLSFAPGETSRVVTVSVVGDLDVEPDETFRVLLTNPQGAVVDDGEGLGTITNDDGPAVSIADGSVAEGLSGNVALSLVVTLDAPSPAPVTVQYATSGITATSGFDFLAASGVLSFAPGVTTRNVTVLVMGDAFVEPDETLSLTLSNPTGGVLGDAEGIGTILNDDAPPLPAAPEFGELRHGAAYDGTVSGLDDDDFALLQSPYASYEVVVDALAGETSLLHLRRVDALGNRVQNGTDVGTGTAESLRWRVSGSEAVSDEVVRVDRECGPNPCFPVAYRVRAYETTLRGARFNNSATQTTVLIVQNPGASAVSLTVRFWDAEGALVASHTPADPLAPHGLLVLDTSTVAPGASGSVTVAHEGPYGGLAGKAVAIEPATGFAFDTPLEPRPR